MRRLAPAALAAFGLALGCGRSELGELTIPGAGPPFEDGSEAHDAGVAFGMDVVTVSLGDDADNPADAVTEGGRTERGDAEIFTNGQAEAGANPPTDGSAGGDACGPANCGGCCEGELCRVGTGTLAC